MDEGVCLWSPQHLRLGPPNQISSHFFLQFTLVLNSKKEHIKQLTEQLSAAQAQVEGLTQQLAAAQGDEDLALATTEDEEEAEEDGGSPSSQGRDFTQVTALEALDRNRGGDASGSKAGRIDAARPSQTNREPRGAVHPGQDQVNGRLSVCHWSSANSGSNVTPRLRQ